MQHLSRAALAAAGLTGLISMTGCINDTNDLITSASTAGTTAYIVGQEVDSSDFTQAQAFADSRSVALQREAARGDGEHLDALARLLGEADTERFGAWVQHNYDALYGARPAAEEDPVNLAERVVALR